MNHDRHPTPQAEAWLQVLANVRCRIRAILEDGRYPHRLQQVEFDRLARLRQSEASALAELRAAKTRD